MTKKDWRKSSHLQKWEGIYYTHLIYNKHCNCVSKKWTYNPYWDFGLRSLGACVMYSWNYRLLKATAAAVVVECVVYAVGYN